MTGLDDLAKRAQELENEIRRNREAQKTLERSYDLTLEAMGAALDLKLATTGRHSTRVTAFTIAIARAMGISKNQIAIIARGAFLHDFGKMAIPDSILRKPEALTADEVIIMREYCYRGYQMLKKIPFLVEASEIVYAHQEHWDGTGYPRGLKGEKIPLGARLLAVADTLDAIISDQPYRAAQSVQAAREEIERCSGRQFDPHLVSVFSGIPADVWDELRRQIDESPTDPRPPAAPACVRPRPRPNPQSGAARAIYEEEE